MKNVANKSLEICQPLIQWLAVFDTFAYFYASQNVSQIKKVLGSNTFCMVWRQLCINVSKASFTPGHIFFWMLYVALCE